MPRCAECPGSRLTTACRETGTALTSRTVCGVELGYARVSTAQQDLERQIEALTAVGIARERIFLDNKSGAAVDRPGLRAVLGFARRGDVIVVHTLDRLGRTVRDTLNLIHELTERGVGVRNLADPIKVDSADPADATGQLAAVLAYAEHLRDAGDSMAQIVAKTGRTRSSLYRYLPPRPPVAVTAAQRAEGVTGAPAGTATAGAAVVGAS